MEIDQDEDVLRALADGKSMDYELWPDMLPRLILRLEKIIQTEFSIPPSLTPKIPSSQPSQTTQSTDSSPSSTQRTAPLPQSSQSGFSIPGPLMTFYTSITSTLLNTFPKNPPHTIQRVAELLLSPKAHYRTLPSYLHALDRVVHVTSGSNIFPLPPAIPDPSSLSILSNGTIQAGVDPLSISWGNPTSTAAAAAALGSDESLGGALLTPISWLNKSRSSNGSKSPEITTESTEMIEGPNGLGGVETVSVSLNGISSTSNSNALNGEDEITASLRAEGGVTQGELLRQEQKAGVVPAAQLKGNEDGTGEDDEPPHARGPDEVGVEDMGPQTGHENMVGIDIDSAVGRTRLGRAIRVDVDKGKEEQDEAEDVVKESPGTPKREADEEMGGVEKKVKPDDSDTELVDADGRSTSEPKVGDKGETKGSEP